MKKKAVTFGAIALAMSTVVAVGGSLAYFTDTEKAENTFTVGDVDIDLEEPLWDPSEEHIISPGANIDKNPTVTNVGVNDAYIRVKVTISDFDTMKYIIPSFEAAVSNGIINGFDTDKWDIVSEYDSGTDHTAILVYKEVLPSDLEKGNAVEVFSGLSIPEGLNDEVKALAGKNPTITIVAEAIQADGFGDAASAFEAYNAQV